MKAATATLATMFASASAFVPSTPLTTGAVRSSSQGMSMVAKSQAIPFMPQPPKLDGSMAGDIGFDPLNISNWDIDFSKFIVPEAAMMREGAPGVDTLYWMREAELKHGRIAQLAVVGWIAVDLGLRFPGSMFAAVTDSVSAHDAMVSSGAMGVMLLAVFLLEMVGGAAIFAAAEGSGRAPGDFSADSFKLTSNPDKKARLELMEIQHCRLGMLAFSGLVTQAVLYGSSFPYTSGL
ncbi:unnamed protein product [Discosporangium mesarthrocarpum]